MTSKKPKPGYKLVKSIFGKEIEIPQDWNKEFLKNVIQIKGRVGWKGYTQKDFVEKGRGAISLGVNNISKDNQLLMEDLTYVNWEKYEESPEIQVSKGDIIVAQRGSIGKIALIDKEIGKTTINPNVVLLTKSKVNPKFLFNVLTGNFIYKQMKQIVSFNTIPLLTQKQINNFQFYLPPIKMQEKIASILANINNLIDSYDKVLGINTRLRRGLMQQLLTKGIGHKKFKNIFLKFHFLKFAIPDSWEIKNVKQLSTLKKEAVKTGPFGLMLHSSDYVSEGTPLILIKNIQNGIIVDDDIPKISDNDVQRLSRYRVREGDIIFSRVGRVGSSATIEKKHNGWLFSGQTLRIRFDNPELNVKYVNYYFYSNLFDKILIPELLGSTRDSINTKILENFPIIIPPKKEQDQIVSILSQTDTRENEFKKMKSKLETLKKGLMQKLLTGQIHVKV